MSISIKKTSFAILTVGAVAAGLVGSGAGIAQAAPATADERSAGLWYVDRLKLDELAEQGATGEGITIAVVDAAINLEAAELQGANITVKGSYCAFPETGETVPAVSTDIERAGHGTDVVAMLVGNGVAADGGQGTKGIVPDAEVWFYAAGMSQEQTRPDAPGCERYDAGAKELYEDKGLLPGDDDYVLGGPDSYAAWHAVNDGADIVVYSGISADVYGWVPAITKALQAGVPIVAGTPNPDGDLESRLYRSYPYSLNGAVAVSGVDNDGNLLSGGVPGDVLRGEASGSSNLGFVSAASAILAPSGKTGWEPTIAHGTSLATPLIAGTLAIGMQKFPEATANQVLQAMIRTTGNSGIHEPEWVSKQWGYGIANPTALLTANPLDYPDENPLFVFDLNDPRCTFIEEGASGEQETMVSTEECAWFIAPSAEEVWPNGETDQGATEPGTADSSQEQAIPKVVWIAGGTILVGLIAAAIIVPTVVRGSRKRRIQMTPQDFNESEINRG